MSGGGAVVSPIANFHSLRSTPQQLSVPSGMPSTFSETPFQRHLMNCSASSMSARKRKADDDPQDENMNPSSPSPSPGPTTPSRPQYARGRPTKKSKTGVTGGPLPLSRLLETLNPDQLRTVLRSICEQHPQIGTQIASAAPRPTAASALSVLSNYQASLRDAFPYGDRSSSDYAYNRVRQSLNELLFALKDYTPQFLPPQETQPSISLQYLDGATEVVHQLPDWDSFQHNRHKQDVYEEMAQAWAHVIREAAKKGGGIQLQYTGWDQKLAKHNNASGGRLQTAVSELRSCLGWIDGASTGRTPQDNPGDVSSIRQQLITGTYGTANPIQVGPW